MSSADPAPTAADRSQLPSSLKDAAIRVESAIGAYADALDVHGVTEGVRHQLESGGKRVRPALALWWLDQLQAPQNKGLGFALAVEFLHNYFLIHDDIEDGDRVRRGCPTLWVHVGVPLALNSADFLLAEAYRFVEETGCPTPEAEAQLRHDFTGTFRTTVEGQALDLACRGEVDFDLDRYEEIVQKKTARYLALSWVGAARIAGADEGLVAGLRGVGAEIGAAFQLRDDAIDLTAGKGRGQIGCDIREGKPSFFVGHVLQNSSVSAEDRTRFLEVLESPRDQNSESDVEWTIELYRRTGAIEACETAAQQRALNARRRIDALPGISHDTKAAFRDVADYVVGRRV